MDMKKVLLYGSMAALLASCSSSDSSNNNSGGTTAVPTFTVNGKLIDPAIKGARLELITDQGVQANICGTTGVQPCSVWSGDDGSFAFTVKDGLNMSDYHIRSNGGVDAVLGTSFLNVQFSSDFESFRENASGNYDVMVSPVTSMVSHATMAGSSIADANQLISTLLGLSADKLTANPMENADVFKQSYVISKMLLNGVTPTAIMTAVNANSGKALTSDEVLGAIYASDANALADMKSLVAEIANIDFTDMNAGIKNVASVDLLNIVKRVAPDIISGYPAAPTMPSAEFSASFDSLRTKLETLTQKVIPADTAIVKSILQNIVAENAFFEDYANYNNDAAFNAEVDKITAASQLVAGVNAILSDPFLTKVYVASTPLAAPLADNNAIADYYFKSDISNVQKAISMISNTNSDSQLDAIYLEAIRAYATYGLHELANNYADALIRSTANRANAFMEIGKAVSVYDKTNAVAYLDKSNEIYKVLLKDAEGTSTLTSLLGKYLNVATNYYRAGDITKGDAATTVIDDYISELTQATNPKKSTVTSSLLFAQRDAIGVLIEDGQYQAAIDLFPVFMARIAENYNVSTLAGTKESSVHNVAAMAYADMSKQMATIATAEPTLKNAALAKFNDMYTAFKALDKAAQVQKTTYFANILPALYLNSGKDVALADIKAIVIDTTLSDANQESVLNAINGSYAALMAFVAKDTRDFATAKSILADNVTIRTGAVSTEQDAKTGADIDAYITGLGTLAGDTYKDAATKQIAIDAMDYLVSTLEANKANLTKNAITSLVLGSYSAASLNFDAATRYLVPNGYTDAADYFIKMGETAKANDALDKALAYVEAADVSYYKSYALSLIGYYYSLNNNTADATATFDKAVALDMSTLTNDAERTKAFHYSGLAKDYAFRNTVDKDAKVIEYMEKAITEADTYTASALFKGDSYRFIATGYNDAGMQQKAIELLELVPTKINTANPTTSHRAIVYKDDIITVLASFGLTDQAYAKAQTLFASDATNLNASIEIIAETIAAKTDFKNSTIAFSDTDKDGRPDFFLPHATPEQIAASGLTADDDIDGDGDLNNVDKTPFFAQP